MKKFRFNSLSFIIIMTFFYTMVSCQEEKKQDAVSIGFYNLENLFDTINDVGMVNSEEFTPQGKREWTSARYHEKLAHMAYVISRIAMDDTPDGLAVCGVCEVENRGVLDDLVKEASIKDRHYQIVHFDSPDRRGIDVALLYQAKFFKVVNVAKHRLTLEGDSSFRSRDQLVVSGLLNGDEITFIVNHWPSRYRGEEASRPKRKAAAELSRHIVDSLHAINPKAKILVMGDLNDDPTDPSVIKYLQAKGNAGQLKEGDLFDPMINMFANGEGSLEYRDKWNFFDQIIVSQTLLNKELPGYHFVDAKVFKEPFIFQAEGRYKGYPLRTFAGGKYLDGYSDHLPVYAILRHR